MSGLLMRHSMANKMLTCIGCLLGLSLSITVVANEEEENLPMGFLEFLGEGQTIDGEYHDPLQMRDWQQNELADGQAQDEEQNDE